MSTKPNVKALSSSLAIPMAMPGQAPPRRKSITPPQPTTDNNNTEENEIEPALIHKHRPTVNKSRNARSQYADAQLTPLASSTITPQTFAPSSPSSPLPPSQSHSKSRATMRKSTAFLHASLDSEDEEFTKKSDVVVSSPTVPNNKNHNISSSSSFVVDNDDNDVSVVDTGALTNEKVRIVPKITLNKKSTQPGFCSPIIIILISLLGACLLFISTLLAREGGKAYQLSLFNELNEEQRTDLLQFKNDLLEQIQQKRAQYNGINLLTEEQLEFWSSFERMSVLNGDSKKVNKAKAMSKQQQ